MSVTLLRGDARVLLPWLAWGGTDPDVQAIVTAPPFRGYAVGRQMQEEAEASAEPRFAATGIDVMQVAAHVGWYASWLPAAQTLTRRGGVAWLIAEAQQMGPCLSVVQTLGWPVRWLWTKPGGEALLCLSDLLLTAAQVADVRTAYEAMPGGRRSAAWPVGFVRLLLDTSPPGLVLDPFCGGGSTLVAAAQLGREALGIDLDPEAIERSATALEAVGVGG